MDMSENVYTWHEIMDLMDHFSTNTDFTIFENGIFNPLFGLTLEYQDYKI